MCQPNPHRVCTSVLACTSLPLDAKYICVYNYVYMRANVVLPNDLINEVDRIAGARKRSKFLEEAAREKIEALRLEKAFADVRGILKDDPRFSTHAKVRKYIRDFRKKNSVRF